jgi:hypothetical protein
VSFHLAQVNLGRMKAPLDHPSMAAFVARLADVNALADRSPGFVWRLQTPDGDATALRVFEDPLVIVNMSVWESVEALEAFAYRSAHAPVMRDRRQWFESYPGRYMALWWVPAGHEPTVGEAKARLLALEQRGESPSAFSFRTRFPPRALEGAEFEPLHGEAEAAWGGASSEPVDLDGRVFVARENVAAGEVDARTRFLYRQRGAHIWATYEGGPVRHGALAARDARGGRLALRYEHESPAGGFRSGRCVSVPERLADGRLRLHEYWAWDDGTPGRSIVEETA